MILKYLDLLQALISDRLMLLSFIKGQELANMNSM